MWVRKVLFALFVLLLASVQPGYANWWKDKHLWPAKFEPWQSYIVRQNEWNKDGAYGEMKSFIGKQIQYGELCHHGAHEAVHLFKRKADFYEVISFLGYVRSAIAVRMSPDDIIMKPFGVERCVVSKGRELSGGKVFNLAASKFFTKQEVEGLDHERGPCKSGFFYTPLGGQYEQTAVRLSKSPHRHPTSRKIPAMYCRNPTLTLAAPVEHELYEISIPSKEDSYTNIEVRNHAIIANSLANNEEGNRCFGIIYHSVDKVIPSLLAQMSKLYSAILEEKKPDRNHIRRQIATFQWMFAHAMPYARGSAAVGTILSNAFYIYHNMEDAIRPTHVDVVVDIEALSTPLADFLDAYPTFFEGASA